METSSKDPLVSAAEGATRGVLGWTEEKLKGLVEKFHNRDIAFVSDLETINLAKKQRKTSEWELFRDYIEDPDLRILFQMGLTLRDLEKKNRPIAPLRQKIFKKYEIEGLHIAQVVQNGILNAYGYVTRPLGAGPGVEGGPDGHHGINEVWLNDHQKSIDHVLV